MKLPTAAALIVATSAALTASAAFAQGLPKGDCAAPAPRQDLSGCDFSGRDLAGRDFSGTASSATSTSTGSRSVPTMRSC